jgi:DNA-binding IclR family transcriptional regulator
MKLPLTPAPALSRGLAVLGLLGAGAPTALEDLARAAKLPKPSVLRLLRTLQAMGAADREPGGKRWLALARLAPIAEAPSTLRARASAALDRLCADSAQIVELYALESDGMRMIDRREPAGCEVTLRAQIGFLRDRGEVEAVNQIALAHGAAPIGDDHWHYRDGRTVTIAQRKVRALVGLVASRGWAADIEANANGVRRVAAPILGTDGRLEGIIAVAALGPSTAAERLPRLRDLVVAAARAATSKE